MKYALFLALLTSAAPPASSVPSQDALEETRLEELPQEPEPASDPRTTDWLIAPQRWKAGVYRTGRDGELALSNGLVRRVFRIEDGSATVALDDRRTEASLLRAVRPEARLVVDGTPLAVGGLLGQPNQAYLLPEWLDEMKADPEALALTGFAIGSPEERVGWRRVRHHAPNATWPPAGAHVRFDYALTDTALRRFASGATSDDKRGRDVLFEEDLREPLDPETYARRTSGGEPAAVLDNEGKPGELYGPANAAAFYARALPAETTLVEATLRAGTDRSKSWGPGLALVFAERVVKFQLRPGDGGPYGGDTGAYADYGLWDGSQERFDRGRSSGADRALLPLDAAYTLRMRIEPTRIVCFARVDSNDPAGSGEWAQVFEVGRREGEAAPVELRVGKMDVRGAATDFAERGPQVRSRVERVAAYGALDEAGLRERLGATAPLAGLRVSVHHELYDDVPVFSKWITVTNTSEAAVELDRVVVEELAIVERQNQVETRAGVPIAPPDSLHVESDYAMGGMTAENSSRFVVRWKEDPSFTSQVNWAMKTPCLLEVAPERGPDVVLLPNESFSSMRAFLLVQDSTERERRGLSQRRMYRTIAPWVTENPLILHVVSTDEEVVRRAIDQAAECGFEMVSLSFGSGLSMEDDSAANHERFAAMVDYATERGIHLGGYSLLSSRRVQPDSDNCVHPDTGRPGGQTHGYCPALASDWGQTYLTRLQRFFEATGFLQFTHDGSYPGDYDASARPPLQRGVDDSQWVQWNEIRELYQWMRARGVYLRIPDYYYLLGANECGMGYREVNWSLPRAQQVIHTRQNIFDGTWSKTPSMGWMFVPLTQYHGGGAAATIEPLDQHFEHYRRMLMSNLGFGVQAVYRGHRLYDTERVRDMVIEVVDWYRRYRDVLESDLVHGRRADGRDLDWMLHVAPHLEDRGMLVVHNPLEHEVTRELVIPLYYTGLSGEASVSIDGEASTQLPLDDARRLRLELTVPAEGSSWVLLRE